MEAKKSKLEELRAKRAQQDQQQQAAEQEAGEKQLVVDEEQVALLRKPGMHVVDLGRRVALISKPSHLEFERFMDSQLTMQDHLQFIQSCVHYPPVMEVYQQYPAYVATLSNEAAKMLGVERKTQQSK